MPTYSRWAAAAAVTAFLAAAIVTLPRYGMTLDEALGNLFFGERHLHYFASFFDRSYLDYGDVTLWIHRREPDLSRSPWRQMPWAFPPLADTLSAASMELFGHCLHWLDPIDAFHLATPLLVALLLWRIHAFAAPRLGTPAALGGIVMLATYPRFWGDLHNNPKDVPETVVFSLAVMALAGWAAAPSAGRSLVAGTLAGCAAAIKPNALSIPLVGLLGLSGKESVAALWHAPVDTLRRQWRHLALMALVAAVVFVASWPYLHLPRRFWRRLGLFAEAFATQGHRAPPPGWNPDPILQTVATMPEMVALLLMIGLARAGAAIWRGTEEAPTLRLLLAWACVPVLRASVPGAVNFDGIRHFFEFLPAATLLAGYGLAGLIEAARPRLRAVTGAVLVALLGGNTGAALWRYHPFESLYFNEFVGGLRGAGEIHGFPEATDYWGSSYRSGMGWLAENAPVGSLIHVPVFPWIPDVSAGWLRADLRLIGRGQIRGSLERGVSVYVMFVTRRGWYDSVARGCETSLEPAHVLVVDGAVILRIYRLAPPDLLRLQL